MRALLLLLAVVLVGCDQQRHHIILDQDSWVCTRVEQVTETRLQPVGKTVAVVPDRRPRCVVYERMGWR